MYSYFICEQNSSTLKLVTHEWFEYGSCNKRKLVALNKFDINSKRWQKNLTNHEKFKNFNQCEIKVQDQFNVTRHKTRKTLPFQLPFMEIVAEYANFTLNFTLIPVNNSQLEIRAGFITFHYKYSITSFYQTVNLGLIVTDGELFTDYEKLLLPFDKTTWILLIGTFFVKFMIIFIVNQNKSGQLQKIIFVKGINFPALNVVSTFFGIPQARLPKNSFARFVLMMLIIFCLIIRTAYQGVLFDYMNSDMRKPRAKTIDEVFEKNFTILSHKSHIGNLFVESLSPERRKNVKNDGINVHDYQKSTSEILKQNKPKTAVVAEEHLEMVLIGIFKIKPNRIEGNIFTIPVGIGMYKNHFMYDSVEEIMKMSLSSGIFNQHLKYYRWKTGQTRVSKNSLPDKKILTMENLSYGFNIWLIACAFAILQFIFELIFKEISKRFQKVEATKEIKMMEKKEFNEETSKKSFIEVENLEEVESEAILIQNEIKSTNESQETLNNLSKNVKKATENLNETETKTLEVCDRIEDENKSKEEDLNKINFIDGEKIEIHKEMIENDLEIMDLK
ncbi:hypothetical protein PVAND_016645 [Polypedilum vanderplanki]|uniref:Uncharacterized protein n=1 Tax=Polypedilum vanderplanki TaxID=319348 RepID=A0A9J6BG12_POLVA|nr:hypothetical protein PVAND_016645 [Polypedilum vanderplanki]